MNNKYIGKDNYGKPKSDYLNRINNMTEKELEKETKHKIWLSAYASNNPKSDYHWHVDACYDLLIKRHGSDKQYAKYWKEVYNNR